MPLWSRPVATSGPATVWLADLDDAAVAEGAAELLSEDERARAERFVFDRHRRRFVAARGWLRECLAERLNRPAASLRFEYGPVGKPALAGEDRLRFNLSHSDRYALLAVAEGIDVGVDIECVRPLSDMDALAERVFSDAERAALAAVAAERRVEAFFAGWTRKEAYVKARGEGIALLRAIEVAMSPGEAPRLLRVADRPDEPEHWSIEALSPVQGFAAAVCLQRL